MPSPVKVPPGVASAAFAFEYEKASRQSNRLTPFTIRPVAPRPVFTFVVGITGVLGNRHFTCVFDG